MPLIDELLDAIRTGDLDVGNYILVIHPEDYRNLVASMHSPALIRGVEQDAYFFGFQLRVDSTVPRGQVTVVRRGPPLETRPPSLRVYETIGEFVRPSNMFYDTTHQELSIFRQPAERRESPVVTKTLWDHLDDDAWDDE